MDAATRHIKGTSFEFKIPDEELEVLLGKYTRDITQMDRDGRFDPIAGREEELEKMILILLQRLRKNCLLIGGAGVGKTALFIALAQRVNAGKVPRLIKDARVIEIEMSMISAGSTSRADLDGRILPILRGVAERNALNDRPPIIFCIDEFHQLTVAFTRSFASGVADMMKPYLTTGDLYIVAATTAEEYEDYVRLDPAVDRRFQKIDLHQPNWEETVHVLEVLKHNFEKHYGLTIGSDMLKRIARLTDRLIRNRNNPDKSILALDQACARAVKDGDGKTLDVKSVNYALAADAGVNPDALETIQA